MYLVLIAGGHSAGKRTVARDVLNKLKSEAESICPLQIETIDMDKYQLEPNTPKVDFERLEADMQEYENDSRHVLLVHGNYALANDKLCDRAQLKIFLDTDADVRLSQWILRDSVNGKHTPLGEVLEKYLNCCRSEYEDFIEGTKYKADVLLPQGSDLLNVELISIGILEEVMKNEPGYKSFRGRSGTKTINLRAEAASTLQNMFYSTA